MDKQYIEPSMEVIQMEAEDVVCASDLPDTGKDLM